MSDDVQAIKNLVYSYAEFFDLGDFDSAVALFEHATVRVTGSDESLSGPSVRSLLTDAVLLYEGAPKTKHLTTNVIVRVDQSGLRASVHSYYVALQALPDFALQPILGGRWHDTLEKVDGDWRFAYRVIHPDLVGDISRHIGIGH